jgi:hypothetical protein
MAKRTKGTKGVMTQPYMKAEFWTDPVNHYWETDMYTKESKSILREWIANKIKDKNESARRK